MYILKHKFGASALYQVRQESMKGFLSRRWSFWLALFSCMAFLVGNMVGQHGWSAFWQSVWGEEVVVVYDGVVPPLAGLPANEPFTDCRDIKEYDRSTFSIHYMGDYDSGGQGCGSHPAVDILTPKGTPTYAMANGRIARKEERSWGFGNTLVLEFPGPDPDSADSMTTFFAGYAHLGQVVVEEGQTVAKGQLIAYTGQTGFATAAHLHFQIDRAEAPFHLYWPFTTTEATEQGLSFVDAVNSGLGRNDAYRYTLDPLAYIQRYGNGESGPIYLAQADTQVDHQEERIESMPSREPLQKTITERLSPKEVWKLLRAGMRARRAARMARLSERRQPKATSIALQSAIFQDPPLPKVPVEELLDSPCTDRTACAEQRQSALVHGSLEENKESEPQPKPEPEPLSTAETNIPMPKAGSVASLSILHDGSFADEWEDIVIFARDEDGNFVHNVRFDGELKLQAYNGAADFSPAVLTEEQFDERGRALVRMFPRGNKTIIPAVRGVFKAQGEPMVGANVLSTRAAGSAGG